MHYSLKPLNDQVVVITGASSGIGLATARAAAAKGARVVLSSRNGDALADACRRIESEGGQAVNVVADVGRREDVQRLEIREQRECADARHGRLAELPLHAGHVMQSSAYTRASLHPVVTAAALTVAGVAIAALMAGNGAPKRDRRHLQHLH